MTNAEVTESVEVITSFTIIPSLKRRGMQGTSAVSGRTSSTHPLIRLGGARRRCSSWRRSAGNTKRDTGRSSHKSWGWAGGSAVYLSEMCGYFWPLFLSPSQTGRTAFMCLQMFQRFVSGSLKRGSWTPAEDDLLRELVDKMRIGNFIPYTQSNHITLLHQSACLPVINELHVLVLHANTLKPLLFPVSYFMEGRDPAQLIYRWNQVLDPSLKRGPWTKQEDKVHRGLSGYTIADPHQCTISSVNGSERKYLFVFLWWDSAA